MAKETTYVGYIWACPECGKINSDRDNPALTGDHVYCVRCNVEFQPVIERGDY